MNLLPDENIIYRTGVHWIVLLLPSLVVPFFGFWGIFFLIGGIEELRASQSDAASFIFAGVVYLLPPSYAIFLGIRQMRSAKFILTSKRIVLNSGRGVLKHREAEMPLDEIRSLVVEPSRFAYPEDSFGTIFVTTRQGSVGPFRCVSRPEVFRKKVEEQIMTLGSANSADAGGRSPGVC